MTITAKAARVRSGAIVLYASSIHPSAIETVVADLLDQRDASVWPARGETAGGVSGGGKSDPTAGRAGSREYREAVARLADVELHLRRIEDSMRYLSTLRPQMRQVDMEAVKVRCGERTPDDIRRDPWYSGDVAACTKNAEEWTRADGTSSVRTSGLCVTHRKQWDDEQRARASERVA